MTIRLMWLMGVALALVTPAAARDQAGAMIAGGVMVVVLLLVPPVLFYLAARVRAKAAAAESWARAEGTVTAVSVETQRARNSRSYIPHIAYRFEVGRQTFTGKRLRFGWIAFHNRAAADAVVAGYRVGGPITVRYDSCNPADNVVKVEANTWNYRLVAWLFVGLDVVFAITIAMVFLGKR